MLKTFCLSTLVIFLFGSRGYSTELPADSISKVSKIFFLKQSIVKTALDEFEWWRSVTTLRESDEKAIGKLQQYWLSVGRQTREKQLKDSLWQEQHPWSAVFISWVMSQAGAGKKIKNSPNHAGYIVWARKNIHSKKEIFTAYDICDPCSAWPEPGDLICKNRDGNNFSLATIKASDISHADIVVEVDRLTRTITTIGGNLCNTVSKRIIHLDADGYLDHGADWQLMDDEKGNPAGKQSEFFAIIKLRTQKNNIQQLKTFAMQVRR